MIEPKQRMSRWTDKQIADLKDGYASNDRGRDIAKRVGRPQTQIYSKAQQLGLAKRHVGKHDRRHWLPEDDARLTDMFNRYISADVMAISLDRTEAAVRMRFVTLGLVRDPLVMRDLSWAPPELVSILTRDGPDAFRAACASARADWEAGREARKEAVKAERLSCISALREKHREPAMERPVAMVFKRAIGMKLQEIGDEYGITRERVRQILQSVVIAKDEENE